MSKSIITRLLIWFGLWLGAIFLPWWLILLLVLIAVWSQPAFYELLLVGLWYDSMYGPGGPVGAAYWPLLATLIILILVWSSDIARKNMTIYRHLV